MQGLVFLFPAVVMFCQAASLGSQNLMTTPKGYVGKEGMGYGNHPNQNGYAYVFGIFNSARYQQVDGELRGRKMSISAVGYRIDHAFTRACWDRTWGVRLLVSECDYDKISQTLATNPTSTPQQVFLAKVSWPTLGGSGVPRPWIPALAFRFSSPYAFAGTSDLLLDYSFGAGDLTHSTNRPKRWMSGYYLDAVYYVEQIQGTSTTHVSSKTPCGDLLAYGQGSYAASSTLWSTTYADTHRTHALRGKVEIRFVGNYLAPNKPAIIGIGFAGNLQGIDIGAACNRLYLDVMEPFNAFIMTTDQNGHTPSTPITIPWSTEWNQRTLWVQGAWDQSGTGICGLTTAQSHRIAAKPDASPRKVMIYKGSFGPVTSVIDSRPEANPITLYTYR